MNVSAGSLLRAMDMRSLKARLVVLYAGLLVGNVAVIVWAYALFHGDSIRLGLALLAYTRQVHKISVADASAPVIPA